MRAPYLHLTISLAFLANTLGPCPALQAQNLNLPVPGVMVHLSPVFTPAQLQGITIHPENALQFDFLIHRGDQVLEGDQKKEEYKKLIKYFLASLTIPDKDQWVNLSPYENNRIIKDDFGKTEMGRDLLAEDYMLKQITSSLIYPEAGLGKKFWDEVYERAWNEYRTTNIPVNTFNKVWIVPDQAIVYESGNTAYILKSHLKVMLEEDYLALSKHQRQQNTVILSEAKDINKINSFRDSSATPQNDVHFLASQVIRAIILPELEKEVNNGKNFANLRQMYSGMILATWYKKALKESLLGKVYADKAKVKGVDQNPRANEEIYQRYIRAFKKGVFNYIKEDADKYTNEAIPRKYFSGGFDRAMSGRNGDVMVVHDLTMLPEGTRESAIGAINTPMEEVLVNLKGIASTFVARAKVSSERPNKAMAPYMRNQENILLLEAGGEPKPLTDKIKVDEIVELANQFLVRLNPMVQILNKIDLVVGKGRRIVQKDKTELRSRYGAVKDFQEKLRDDVQNPVNQMLWQTISTAFTYEDTGSVKRTNKNWDLPNNLGVFDDLINAGNVADMNTFTNALNTMKHVQDFLNYIKEGNEISIITPVSRGNVEAASLPTIDPRPSIGWSQRNDAMVSPVGAVTLPLTAEDLYHEIIKFPGEVIKNNNQNYNVMVYESLGVVVKVPREEFPEQTQSAVLVKDSLNGVALDFIIAVVNGKHIIIQKMADQEQVLSNLLVDNASDKRKLLDQYFQLQIKMIQRGVFDLDPKPHNFAVSNGHLYLIDVGDKADINKLDDVQRRDAIAIANLQIKFLPYHFRGVTEIFNESAKEYGFDTIENIASKVNGENIQKEAPEPMNEKAFMELIKRRLNVAVTNQAMMSHFEGQRKLFYDAGMFSSDGPDWGKELDKAHDYLVSHQWEVAEQILVAASENISLYNIVLQRKLNYLQRRLQVGAYYLENVKDWDEELGRVGQFIAAHNWIEAKKRLDTARIDIPIYKVILRRKLLKLEESYGPGNSDEKPPLAKDAAMNAFADRSAIDNVTRPAKFTRGGIDFNPANLAMIIKRDGRGVPLPLAQQDMAQLSHIQGFDADIIEIRPAVNVPIISELQQKLQSTST